MKLLTSAGLFGLAALISNAVTAQEDEVHGRVSFADESALVRGSADDDWSYATVNAIILPGDTVWADDEGAVELEFRHGTFVRLADGSKLDVASIDPETQVSGAGGSFYVQRLSTAAGDVSFETPTASIAVHPGAQVRFDVLSEGSTTVSVRWGAVTVLPHVGPTLIVNQGERIFIDPGYAPSAPAPFDIGEEDAFDTWNRDRSRAVSIGKDSIPILGEGDQDLPMGSWSLYDQGDWVYVDNAYYWKPAVVDFVPYRHGYWSYEPHCGYIWVGYHPFSYFTSHYGYWHHHDHYGWIWSYNHTYAPAHVATYRYGDLFVWTPVDVYGHPIYYGHDAYHFNGITISLSFSTFSYSNDLLYGHHHVHALDHDHLRSVRGHDWHEWRLRHDRDGLRDHGSRTHATLEAREYRPERVVRGHTIARANLRDASDRANALEARMGRPRATDRIQTESAPQHEARTSRSARTRDVRLSPQVMARTEPRQAARPSAPNLGRNNAPRPSRTQTLDNRDVLGAPERGIEDSRPGTRTERVNNGTHRTTRVTPNGDSAMQQERPAVRGDRESGRPSETPRASRTGRIDPAPREDAVEPAPRVRSESRNEVRNSAPVQRENNRPTHGVRPANPGRERTSTQPRSSAPQTVRSAPRPYTPEPRVSTPRASAPRVSAPAPQVSSPRTSAPQLTRPSSPEPRVSTPSPRVQQQPQFSQPSTPRSSEVRSRSGSERSSSSHGSRGESRGNSAQRRR